MICQEYKCIFIHIPKTAGQSIENFFLNLVGLTWETRDRLLLKYNENSKLGPERLAHLTTEEYLRCGHINEDKFSSYFKFSFVRNPWERLVSEYHYQKYDQRFSFNEFVKYGFPKPDLSNAYRHIMPQYDFIYNQEGKLLVDFVGKFETLQRDFDEVCRILEIEDSVLPHANSHKAKFRKGRIRDLFNTKKTQSRPHYSAYYDDEIREIIEKIYHKDIYAFNYSYEQINA